MKIPDRNSLERDRHLQLLALHVLENLFTWTMPADFGVDYGYSRDGKWERSYLSSSYILAELGWPEEDFDEHTGWSEAASDYAKGLMDDLGEFIRTRCRLEVEPRPKVRRLCVFRDRKLLWSFVDGADDAKVERDFEEGDITTDGLLWYEYLPGKPMRLVPMGARDVRILALRDLVPDDVDTGWLLVKAQEFAAS